MIPSVTGRPVIAAPQRHSQAVLTKAVSLTVARQPTIAREKSRSRTRRRRTPTRSGSR